MGKQYSELKSLSSPPLLSSPFSPQPLSRPPGPEEAQKQANWSALLKVPRTIPVDTVLPVAAPCRCELPLTYVSNGPLDFRMMQMGVRPLDRSGQPNIGAHATVGF